MEEINVAYSYGSGHSWNTRIADNTTLESYRKIYKGLIEEVVDNKGFVYVKLMEGQKKNSIAKLFFENPPEYSIQIYKKVTGGHGEYKERYHHNNTIENEGDIAKITLKNYHGTLKWDSRSNKPKADITDRDIVWLKGYSGHTVWNVVSAENMREEALKQPIYDIDDKELSVGDKVLYINVRYGCGMVLQHGVVDSFEVEYHAHNNTVSIYTIVVKDNVASKIANSKEFIFKEN